MAPVPIHLHPTAEAADRALLPGDPGRALALAQELLSPPAMFNHHRGLWGYVGAAPDGRPLMIQSTGMGGPSAAIVLRELAGLGLRRAVRVGTCGALGAGLAAGDVVVAGTVLARDGTGRALGADGHLKADAALTERLERATGRTRQTVVSSDLFYDERGLEAAWRGEGAVAVEMEAAALIAEGERSDVAVGCVLVVSDAHAGGEGRLSEEELLRCGLAAGRAAADALSP